MSVFRHHFLQHPGTAGHVSKWPGEITLDKEIKWTVMTEKVWKWEQNEVGAVSYKNIGLMCSYSFFFLPDTIFVAI